ncbi:hypothetical protein [Paenibacillus spongiae]|uniref:Uncharacterized protein n=1 Tax=Paenibacillus spongiae TaxID=2909671 RepID=A0ABY5SJ41_9BACL|nr:hypothetical protein [Paenibacillus spongiae]UVI32727.1 hypothetical protein L1F29_13260 [Paenibacillus spongiae]
MLTFEQKIEILDTFPELQRKDVSLGRTNYHYEDSAYDKKNVVYHLHKNGNGYVYVGQTPGYAPDDKGFVNIRSYSAEELRAAVEASIAYLSTPPAAVQAAPKRRKPKNGTERWSGPDKQVLELKFEDDLWYLYTGLNLEMAFETYEEAEEYLTEEGFTRS